MQTKSACVLFRAQKKRAEARLLFDLSPLYGNYVYGAKFAAVFGIGFCFKRNFLPFFQSAETLRLNCREVYENIVAALVVGNKTITLSVVEPFNSFAHIQPPKMRTEKICNRITGLANTDSIIAIRARNVNLINK